MFPIGGVEEVQLQRELEAGEEVVQGPGGVVVHVCAYPKCELSSNNRACPGGGKAKKERKKERKKEERKKERVLIWPKRELEAGEEVVQGPGGVVVYFCVLSFVQTTAG